MSDSRKNEMEEPINIIGIGGMSKKILTCIQERKPDFLAKAKLHYLERPDLGNSETELHGHNAVIIADWSLVRGYSKAGRLVDSLKGKVNKIACFITLPFDLEGKKNQESAQRYLQELKEKNILVVTFNFDRKMDYGAAIGLLIEKMEEAVSVYLKTGRVLGKTEGIVSLNFSQKKEQELQKPMKRKEPRKLAEQDDEEGETVSEKLDAYIEALEKEMHFGALDKSLCIDVLKKGVALKKVLPPEKTKKIERNRSTGNGMVIERKKERRRKSTEKILICIIFVEALAGSLYWLWYVGFFGWLLNATEITAAVILALGIAVFVLVALLKNFGTIWNGMFILLGIVFPPLGVIMLIDWMLKDTIAEGVKKGMDASRKQ